MSRRNQKRIKSLKKKRQNTRQKQRISQRENILMAILFEKMAEKYVRINTECKQNSQDTEMLEPLQFITINTGNNTTLTRSVDANTMEVLKPIVMRRRSCLPESCGKKTVMLTYGDNAVDGEQSAMFTVFDDNPSVSGPIITGALGVKGEGQKAWDALLDMYLDDVHEWVLPKTERESILDSLSMPTSSHWLAVVIHDKRSIPLMIADDYDWLADFEYCLARAVLKFRFGTDMIFHPQDN